jgi:ribonuclease BN (tRNA processing enzyme)
MKLKVLGCSGGIGSNLRTTSMLLDHDVLIDAGTGVGDLSLDELSLIDHVFLTHSHLDHITSIPFMLDSVAGMRDRPLMVYGLAATLETLQQHIFNWQVWPDFSRIPNAHQPYMRYQNIVVGEAVILNGRAITPLPANHVVPAVGFRLDSGSASLVYTGDTTSQDEFWNILNKINKLEYIIIETAFPDTEKDLAELSKHLCPSLLAADLAKLKSNPEIYISHLKPGEGEQTMREIGECVRGVSPKMLMNGQVFEF